MAGKLRYIPMLMMSLLGLSACGGDRYPVNEQRLKDQGMYWQRSTVTEAAYMEGPKAQQMLHRDIAGCVTELREMDRQYSLRRALPADTAKNGAIPDPRTPEGKLAQFETPERDAYLLTEHHDYADFEGCMQAKGWERMEHVPYDVAHAAREDYFQALKNNGYRDDADIDSTSDKGDVPVGQLENDQ